MKVEYAVLSAEGTREQNEDFIGILEKKDQYAFFLADGLGGHGKGEVASRCVVEEGKKILDTKDNWKDILPYLFRTTQEALLKKQSEMHEKEGMKTTLNILLFDEEDIQWGHIGDSRTYYFEKKLFGITWKKTLDHSVPQMLVAMKKIKEKEIRRHEDRNRLLKVMGIKWNKDNFTIETSLKKKRGQAFLLCSDGFWEWIEEKEMISLLKKATSVKAWLTEMEMLLLKNAGDNELDNYSAIGVWLNW